MSKPLISVVTPVYNTKKYLPKAVESVLNQTFQDFEYIIIDDGSTDGSYEVLQEYAKKHPSKIRLFKQENQGAFCTYNNCTQLAEGEYILTLNSDDYLTTDCLEIVSSYALEYNVDVVFVNVTSHTADSDQNIIQQDVSSSVMDDEFVILQQEAIGMTWPFFIRLGLVKNNINLYRTSLMKKYPYRTDWYGADYLLNIYMARDIKSAACHPKILYNNFWYKDEESERLNISIGKYYSYEHDMFNEFFIEQKRLFDFWNISNSENLQLIAESRIQRFDSEVVNINAKNNDMSTLEKINALVSYFDEIVIEASVRTGNRCMTEKKVIARIRAIYQEAKNQHSKTSDVDSAHWTALLMSALTDKKYSHEERIDLLRKVLLTEDNPHGLGLVFYEEFCNNNCTEDHKDSLEYFKTREQARAYILMEKNELAANEISRLFGMTFSEPEKYVLLAINCLNCGFIEDAADSVALGLDLFPENPRLQDLYKQIERYSTQ